MLEKGISYVSPYLFRNCSLESAYIPDTAEKIGAGVFYDATVKEVTIPVKADILLSDDSTSTFYGADIGRVILPVDIFLRGRPPTVADEPLKIARPYGA